MKVNPYENEEKIPFIIMEIGINHNGDIDIAKKLIDISKEGGADAVKFQKRTIDIVYSPEVLAAPRKSPWGSTQRQQKEGLEFGKEEFDEIDSYCKEKGMYWFASAWDEQSQDFLSQYDLGFNKIASPMLTHVPLVEQVAEEGRHTFVSTGMSNFEQVDRAVEIFEKKRCPYTVMHAVSAYPCMDEWCNIRMVETLKERYKCPVGYSGHERGILPSVLAVAFGAVAIERHITLDRTMYGSDQAASLERKGLELMARDARSVRDILGDGKKKILSEEEKVAFKLRYFKEENSN